MDADPEKKSRFSTMTCFPLHPEISRIINFKIRRFKVAHFSSDPQIWRLEGAIGEGEFIISAGRNPVDSSRELETVPMVQDVSLLM